MKRLTCILNFKQNNYFKRFVQLTFLVAVVVIVLGAYTRLSNAGLGCPDWPGCYGFLSVPHQDQVSAEYGVIETSKAWKEMIHRYVAGALGVMILFIFLLSIALKGQRNNSLLSSLLLLLVLFQATLGMLTVTMSLQPLIVVGHLLGGFLVINLIGLLLLKITSVERAELPLNTAVNLNAAAFSNTAFRLSLLLIVVVLSQIALGGWLSANYAASFCSQLPFCDGFTIDYSWQQFSFLSVWQLPTSSNYEFGVLPAQARLSIHLLHRFWAIITTLLVVMVITKIYLSSVQPHIKNCVLWVALFLFSQVILGVMMVFWHFPMLMALAHNLCAAFLLMSLVRLSYGLSKHKISNVQP